MGVFNEKALYVSRLMKISMIIIVIGVYFIAKSNTESMQVNEINENKTVIVNKGV